MGWLAEMVRWRHVAPTAPDTLDTYPYLATVITNASRTFYSSLSLSCDSLFSLSTWQSVRTVSPVSFPIVCTPYSF